MNDRLKIADAVHRSLDPPEPRPVRPDTHEIRRLAEQELEYIADILATDWRYPGDWTEKPTRCTLAEIVEEMREMLE